MLIIIVVLAVMALVFAVFGALGTDGRFIPGAVVLLAIDVLLLVLQAAGGLAGVH